MYVFTVTLANLFCKSWVCAKDGPALRLNRPEHSKPAGHSLKPSFWRDDLWIYAFTVKLQLILSASVFLYDAMMGESSYSCFMMLWWIRTSSSFLRNGRARVLVFLLQITQCSSSCVSLSNSKHVNRVWFSTQASIESCLWQMIMGICSSWSLGTLQSENAGDKTFLWRFSYWVTSLLVNI